MTRYYSYYSKQSGADDDFNEYDPTPYEGGYDIGLIYGRPLPPSEEICYRHPSSEADDNNYNPPQFKSSEPKAYDDEKKLTSEYKSYMRRSSKHELEAPDVKKDQEESKPEQKQRSMSGDFGETPERALAGEGGYGRKKSTSSKWWVGSCCSSNVAEQ